MNKKGEACTVHAHRDEYDEYAKHEACTACALRRPPRASILSLSDIGRRQESCLTARREKALVEGRSAAWNDLI
ncbi:hypothetical protein EVAR_89593_1 [Eumeta japonica]|uniref:Uncharacterized protein n=1 Tax=Eumeta variegata TaxID=151549 RepID=A0A4C1XQM9_EUMVA|nr:hypothetical protein EVAR_89593_1 [Eumeta japonica]